MRNKPFNVAIGVTAAGECGIWAVDDREGTLFQLCGLTELKNRGVEDVRIVICDGLKGLPESINTALELVVV